jgi:DNA uptake protein ComE-like DNA-binding protein
MNHCRTRSVTAPNCVRARRRLVSVVIRLLPGCLLVALAGVGLAQAPSITNQPGNQVVLLGRPVVFEVRAEGELPMAFQWQFNGTNMPGATNATLALSAAGPDCTGVYRATLSNATGVLQSREVSLSVFAVERATSGAPALKLFWVPAKSYRIDVVTNLAPPQVWHSWRTCRYLNMNTVTVEQLSRIPEIDDNLATAIVSCRVGPDGVEGTEDDRPFRSVQELMRVPGLPPSLISSLGSYFTTQDPPAFMILDAAFLGMPPPPAPGPEGLPVVHDRGFFRVVLLEETGP